MPSYFLTTTDGLASLPQFTQPSVIPMPSGFDRGTYQGKIPQILRRMQFPCTDALSYAHFTEAKVDVVLQCSNKIWDIHPLIPIIRAAGGIVTTWNNDNPIKAGNILCSSNKSIHDKLLKILKPVS